MTVIQKRLLTAAIVAVAIIAVVAKYGSYLSNPWTRDGQVRADVIQITPRVSGPIVNLQVRDNQRVKAGDLLFEIDPRTFAASFEQASAQYDKAVDSYGAQQQQVEAADAQVQSAQAMVLEAESAIRELESEIEKDGAEYERQQTLLQQRATSQKSVERTKANYEASVEQRQGAIASLSQAKAELAQARAALAEAKASLGAPGEANASLREARAAQRQAQLNLEFTRVVAPVEGYVTNLNLRPGSQAVANQPALALVDTASFWVHGFFRETDIADIQAGNRAIVTLMTYPDQPLEGRVDSLGWGIAQQDGSTGFDLLPNVSPSFDWIRLAQRVPVRIHLTTVPESVALRVGTTASVLVRTGTHQQNDRTAASGSGSGSGSGSEQ